MIRAGYSPSVRVFEAASCGTPILTDRWDGLETVLVPGVEILPADSADDVLDVLDGRSEADRLRVAVAARARVLAEHSAAHRAGELEAHLREAQGRPGTTVVTPGIAGTMAHATASLRGMVS